jgi:ribosomal protein S18 acetylase RimI-like enzyme
MGVVEDGHLGLFDLVTDSGVRNRGYGRRLLFDLLAWGLGHGARRAYLQVMLNNAPAIHLYRKVGFQEAYQYWYRIAA